MKFVLIPDSFKGTLSSEQICEIAKEKVEKHFPGAETACVPVADGGEGSVDAFITALGGSKVTVKVKNPYFEDMDSYYGLINEGKTAVIEMASCAGLPLVEDRKDPRKTTTYGVGQLILRERLCAYLQEAYEQDHTREEWMNIAYKNYL